MGGKKEYLTSKGIFYPKKLLWPLHCGSLQKYSQVGAGGGGGVVG